MSEEMKDAIFLIESGRMLDLTKHHVAEVQRVDTEVRAMLNGIGGVRKFRTDQDTGVLLAVHFERSDKVHPDFRSRRSRSGGYAPRQGTEWAKRFKQQRGYEPGAVVISRETKIPTSIHYTYKSEESSGHGVRRVGAPFNESGFMWLTLEGPFAMWVPDLPRIIADMEDDGKTEVQKEVKEFKMEFEGCRRIEPEEWEIMRLQQVLADKRAAKKAVAV